ncbi:MAG: YhdH/YhfP family quinone oxidoreductase [Rickettsiales bacterium]|jgi:acrylyl-CoA reductase (NADPH)|nr:YhdH/YhfP family quinone oxidoreductase [Rickettsiales bacterium]
MHPSQTKALIVSEQDKVFDKQIDLLPIPKLADGEVLIKTSYSSLNYKDALSASGHKGVTRNYPHVPGIDCAGIITDSNSDLFQRGDEVIATGFDLGMNRFGGFCEYVTVPADWCIAKPENLSLKQAMVFGTAGLTSALSILVILQYKKDLSGKNILITGASGGVGLLSALLFKELGYSVTVTTRVKEHSFLYDYNFNDVILTNELESQQSKPLLNRQFNAAIDILGGNILANILKIIDYHGVIASCGNITDNSFQTTVLPMIIRGVKLIGITSANALMHNRLAAWALLNSHSHILTENLYREIALEELPVYIDKMLLGQHSKRTIIKF